MYPTTSTSEKGQVTVMESEQRVGGSEREECQRERGKKGDGTQSCSQTLIFSCVRGVQCSNCEKQFVNWYRANTIL